MRFSIIVPVYNVEEYLTCCLESVLKQSFTDFEIILVDDGSTDNSGQICDEYAKEYSCIRCYHKINGGLSEARNYGINVAQGDYLIFVDSDDWMKNGALAELESALSDNPEVLITRLVEVYEDKYVSKDIKFDAYLQKEKLTKKRAVEWMMKESDNSWPAQKCVVSRKFINDNNLRFKEGRLHEDIDWTCNLCYSAKKFSGYIGEWYYHRMKRKGSITTEINVKRIMDVIEMAGSHYAHYKSESNYVNKLVMQRFMRSVYSSINLVKNCSESDRKMVVECIQNNKEIFSIAPRLSHKAFSLGLRIFGADFALKVLCAL